MSLFNEKRGGGEAISALIMFIAVIIVTVAVVMSFKNYVFETQQSVSVQNDLTSNKLKTSISITNIYYNSSSSKIYVYVKNIGETKVRPQLFDLFVDDSYTTNFTAYYADNLSKTITLFQPQETLVIITPVSFNSGTHDVRVVTQYGIGDKDSFNI